jgi:hypothetical protein
MMKPCNEDGSTLHRSDFISRRPDDIKPVFCPCVKFDVCDIIMRRYLAANPANYPSLEKNSDLYGMTRALYHYRLTCMATMRSPLDLHLLIGDQLCGCFISIKLQIVDV